VAAQQVDKDQPEVGLQLMQAVLPVVVELVQRALA